MTVSKFSISLMPNVISEIEARAHATGGERSATINRMIDRYTTLLNDSRRHLREILTDAEIGLVLDVFNGTLFAEPFSIQLVAKEIEDSLVDGYAEKWKCDGPELVHKLNGLSYADQVALVDAVERWWNRVSAGESKLKPAEALKR